MFMLLVVPILIIVLALCDNSIPDTSDAMQ